jgi:hypothetical protein
LDIVTSKKAGSLKIRKITVQTGLDKKEDLISKNDRKKTYGDMHAQISEFKL